MDKIFLTKVVLPVPENPDIMMPFKGPSPFYKYYCLSFIEDTIAIFAVWS